MADKYVLSSKAWSIINQAETRRRMANINEKVKKGDDHVKIRRCGLNAAEMQVVTDMAKKERMVAINYDIEDGEPWISLTTADLSTKIFPAEIINDPIKAIFADAHTIKLVFDAKTTFRILKRKDIELQNFVDVKEVAEFTKLRTGLKIHRSLTVGTLCLHLYAWDHQAYCSEDEYVYSNRKLPYWWKKFPVERRLDEAYKGGMYNLVRVAMIHASSTLLFLYVEHAVQHDLRIKHIVPHRKDGLRDIVKRIIEGFRIYVSEDNEFLRPFEAKNTVSKLRDLRDRIRSKSKDRQKFVKPGQPEIPEEEVGQKEQDDDVLEVELTESQYDRLVYPSLTTLIEQDENPREDGRWDDKTGSESSSEEEPVSKEPKEIRIPRRKVEPPKKKSKEQRREERRSAKIGRRRINEDLERVAQRVPKSKRSLTKKEIDDRQIPKTKGLRYTKGAKPVSKSREIVEDRFSVSFDDVCSFCGGQGKNFHLKEKCSIYRRYKSGKVTRNLCLYPLCPDRKRHCTAVCFLLHERCEECGGRGHYGYQCGHLARDYLREMYEIYRKYGLYSRKRSSKWNYKLHQ